MQQELNSVVICTEVTVCLKERMRDCGGGGSDLHRVREVKT